MCTAFCFVAKFHVHRFECKASILFTDSQLLLANVRVRHMLSRSPVRLSSETLVHPTQLVAYVAIFGNISMAFG